MRTDEGLKREVGLWGLTANIINVVIGSGIFVLPALVSEGLGPAGIYAYLICGVLISLVMLCFAELGSKIPITGGAYAYIELAFGSYAGFLTTNLFVFGAALTASAAVANAMADALSYLFPVFSNWLFRSFFFILLFGGLAVINIIGVKKGIALIKVTTVLKLIPILILILFGIPLIKAENMAISYFPSISKFGEISAVLFFAFQGAENSLSVGGEVRNPNKTFPRAILFGFTIVLVIYVAVQTVAQGILGASFSSFQAAPLAEVAKRIMGPAGVTLITLGAAVSMFGFLSSDAMNIPRVLFRSSLDGILPIRSLARVHRGFLTPYISIVVCSAIACLLAIIGSFGVLAVLASASILLVYLGVAFATIKLKSFNNNGSQFAIPGGHFIPILTIIVILWFLASIGTNEKVGITAFVILLTLIYMTLKYFKLIKNTTIKKEVQSGNPTAANNELLK
jgi:amino acid transporter